MASTSTWLVRAVARMPRRFNSGEQHREEHGPGRVGNPRHQVHGRLAAPDGADDGIEHVVHRQAPSGDEAQPGVDLAAHVGVGGAGAGIGARHAAVADGGEQHGDHGDQHGGDHVTMRHLADHAERRHGRGGLNQDDSVEDEIPQSQRALQVRGGLAERGSELAALDMED